jgi:hypothetical protein
VRVMERRRTWRCLVLCATLACAAVPAIAGSPAGASDGWRFEVTPYLWGAGLKGDVGLGRLPAQGVEASFSDITSMLDAAGMLMVEGRRDRWGFVVDAIYIDLSDSTATPGQGYGDAEVGLTQQMYTAAATWRVRDGKAPVDLVFGTRYNDLALDLELTSGIAQGRGRDGGVDWWDGLVGARVGWGFADHWVLAGYGEISGGGAKISWQAIAGVDWNFSGHLSGRFGYRYMSLDYDSGGVLYDMDMAGPYAGLGIRF